MGSHRGSALRIIAVTMAIVAVQLFCPSCSVLVAQSSVGCDFRWRPSTTLSAGIGYQRSDARLDFIVMDSLHTGSLNDGIDQYTGFVEFAVPFDSRGKIEVAGRVAWYGGDVKFTRYFREVHMVFTGLEEPLFIKSHEDVTFTTHAVHLELLGRVAITNRFRISAGPTIGYRSVSEYRHIHIVDEPQWRSFGPTLPMEYLVADQPEEDNLALGAFITAGYEIPLSRRWTFVPEVGLRSEFVNPFGETNWRTLGVGGTIGLRYSL